MFGLDFEEERLFHFRLSLLMMAVALLVFASLSTLPSSSVYGKNSNQPGSGTMNNLLRLRVPPRIAWLVFESPPLLWSAYCYLKITMNDSRLPTSNLLLFGMFVLHYVYRDLVYPFLISKKSHPVPLITSVSAFVFCNWNGYLQAQGNLSFQSYPRDFWERFQVGTGVALFLVGFVGVIHSDFILLSLRRSDRQSDSGYKIPRGGAFRYVSCPHFFCEIMEWVGYAIVSSVPVDRNTTSIPNGIAAWAFVAFTCANLVPRAVSHHNYYLRHFKEDYSLLNRSAIIPFIL